jgi:hypothetical protein
LIASPAFSIATTDFTARSTPKPGGADAQERDCQEDRVCEAVTQEGWAVALARLIFMRHWGSDGLPPRLPPSHFSVT